MLRAHDLWEILFLALRDDRGGALVSYSNSSNPFHLDQWPSICYYFVSNNPTNLVHGKQAAQSGKEQKMTTTRQDRVRLLLVKLWQNSQSRMAVDTGVSQSTISNIVTGRFEPGGKVLAAIAGHPLVNAGWLMTGEGAPFDVEQQWVLPIATSLLPGPIAEYSHTLTAETKSVARDDHRSSRYLFRMPEIKHISAKAGDLLLLDTDVAPWVRVAETLVHKLCVIVTGQRTERRASLARVDDLYPDNLPSLIVAPVWPPGASEPSSTETHNRRTRQRVIDLDSPGSKDKENRTGKGKLEIELKQIVAVAQSRLCMNP